MVVALNSLWLRVEYDGTDFHGFVRQPGRRTVQEEIEQALSMLGELRGPVVGAGRTDAGVHARGQLVSCSLTTSVPAERLARALNRILPPDLGVVEAGLAPEGFDACRSATGKLYSYAIWNRISPSPIGRNYVWHFPRPLDERAMRQAAACLLGCHDFRSFRTAGGSAKTTVRTLRRLDVDREGGLVRFQVEADGFLYRMVRNIVGTLVRVGEGVWEPGKVACVLAACDRTTAGPTAPARGLCLEQVFYLGENSSTAMPTPGKEPS